MKSTTFVTGITLFLSTSINAAKDAATNEIDDSGVNELCSESCVFKTSQGARNAFTSPCADGVSQFYLDCVKADGCKNYQSTASFTSLLQICPRQPKLLSAQSGAGSKFSQTSLVAVVVAMGSLLFI